MADDLLINVIGGLISEAIVTLLAQLGSKPAAAESHTHRQEAHRLRLLPIIERAAAGTARVLAKSSRQNVDRIQAFLGTTEAVTIARNLFAGRLLDDPATRDLLKAKFGAALRLFSNGAVDAAIAAEVFDELARAAETALDVAIESGALVAHEAKSTARFNILRLQLNSLERSLNILDRAPSPDELSRFEQSYRAQSLRKFSSVVPPNFDSAVRVPIDSIYISPHLTLQPASPRETNSRHTPLELLASLSRAVVLGNPGGGKSTLAQKLCYDLARGSTGPRQFTPALVILRDFATTDKAKQPSVADHIGAMANAHLQLRPPPGAIEYLLSEGRLLVVFDGLDELLDTGRRRDIADIVESFADLYPEVRILVTSREVGYEQAPLDDRTFLTFRLAPFGEQQVRDYATKWFSLDTSIAPERQLALAESFLRESSSAGDLRSNPLMLALMCNIYRGENYIPQNRPEVYEKCALMLFERWDKTRGINLQLPFEAHIRPALTYVAHWLYSTAGLDSGATESLLVDKVAEYLLDRRFEDQEDARHAAVAFVQFCRGRAWVFTDVGTTANGEALYHFTHRTFLEYFTASQLTRMHDTAEVLFDALRPRIESREWDVVAQLAFQLKNRSSEGAADELLGRTLTYKGRVTRAVLSRLAFCVRTLNFVVPSPRVSRIVVSASLIGVLRSKLRGHWAYMLNAEIVAGLLSVSRENVAVVIDEFESTLRRFYYVTKSA